MKLIKEHINEKFIKDSDPIKDMGIGFPFDDRDFISEKEFIDILIKYMPIILKTKDIPEDILQNGGTINWKHFYEIQDFFKKHFWTINKEFAHELHWPDVLKDKLLKRGFRS